MDIEHLALNDYAFRFLRNVICEIIQKLTNENQAVDYCNVYCEFSYKVFNAKYFAIQFEEYVKDNVCEEVKYFFTMSEPCIIRNYVNVIVNDSLISRLIAEEIALHNEQITSKTLNELALEFARMEIIKKIASLVHYKIEISVDNVENRGVLHKFESFYDYVCANACSAVKMFIADDEHSKDIIQRFYGSFVEPANMIADEVAKYHSIISSNLN